MFRVMDGAEDGIPGVFVDQMADRILVSTRGCSITADLESELRDTGLPVFHKKLEQNQKEAPVQIAGPLLPLQFTALEQGVRFKIDMPGALFSITRRRWSRWSRKIPWE